MKVINLADIIIIFMGFYFLISTAMMKVHGKVNRMLVGKKYDIKKARDLPGFISVIFLPNIIIGVITMAAGYNTQLILRADGEDEKQAVEAISQLFESKFEED